MKFSRLTIGITTAVGVFVSAAAVQILSFVSGASGMVKVAYAESHDTYRLMQNVPFFGGSSGTVNPADQGLAGFANTWIQIFIGVIILLAFVMVVYSGIQYMMTGSVTEKSDAKDNITKAIGGLLLALSAVTILNTINPNLVQLNQLKEITVKQGQIRTPTFSRLVNPDGTGTYYCYKSDKSFTKPTWDKVCATSMEDCQQKYESDETRRESSSCKKYVFYRGGSDIAEDANACFGFVFEPTQNPDASCFGLSDECESKQQQRENNANYSVEVQCKAPDEFGEGSSANTVFRSTGKIRYLNVDIVKDNISGESEESATKAMENCEANGEEWIENNTGENEECSERARGNSCSVVGCDSASEVSRSGVEKYTEFSCPADRANDNGICPPEERLSCENCYTLSEFNLTNHFRPDPRVCHEYFAVLHSQCKINSGLAEKLQDLKENLQNQDRANVYWRLTEAWPPTVLHQSQCHSVGTCVDIALRKNSQGEQWQNNMTAATELHVKQINTFIDAAESAGLSVTYEVGSEELMNFLTSGVVSVPPSKIINIGVAPHFSVYRSADDR